MVEINENGKRKQGFASITPERRKEIASIGGKAAHEKGSCHEFSSEEASAAGKKRWANRKDKQPTKIEA